MVIQHFVLTQDDDTNETPLRPTRVVSQGLAPTSDVPAAATQGYSHPPCLVPCPQCGVTVLHVDTAEGLQALTLPEHGGPRCYVVQWHPGTARPWGNASRAAAVHQCGGG